MNTGLYISCEINGLAKSTFDMVDFTLEEALSTLYNLEIMLASYDANLDVDGQLLKPVTFKVLVDGQELRVINGIVAEMYRGDSGHHRTYYTLTVRPTLWLMTLTQDNRIFHFKSIPDILDELLLKHNIQSDKKLLDNHQQWEYTTQRNETDYHFFCRLAAEEGITFWFEEEKLFYSDSRIGMMGGPSLSYNTHIQSACRENVIHSLRYGAKMTPNAVHLKEYKFSHPTVALSSKDNRTKNRPQYPMYESYGRYEDDAVANQYSTYRLDAYLAESALGKAQSNCIELRPGKTFKITDHPTADMNQSWQLVSVVHRGSLPQSVGNEAGDKSASLSNDFTFVPSNIDWRPAVKNKPTIFGDETATVVGPAGEEIYTNEYGEVKIHFHWNQYDAADEKASCWVRTGQGWNGNGFGMMAIPRIGQEVIIAYLNGDIDRPIIVGTVYNGKNAPPLKLPEAKTQTSLKSKTHKGEGFNELRFEDAEGSQELFMHAQKDMNTKVLNDRTTHVLNNHTENVDNNQEIHIKVNQTTTVGGDQSIDVTGNRTDHVVKDETVNIDVNQQITVGADQTILVKGNRHDHVILDERIDIDGNQATTIAGSHTVKVTGREDVTVTGPEKTIYENTHELTVNGTQTVIIHQARDLTVNGLLTEQFTASHQQIVTGNQIISVTEVQTTTAPIITVDGEKNINLVSGKSSITMAADGTITLQGIKLIVEMGDKISMDAGEIKLN